MTDWGYKLNKKEVYRWMHKYKKVGWNDQPTNFPLHLKI